MNPTANPTLLRKTQTITVCAFIHHEGKMLAAQRAAHKRSFPNQWELVGGHLEFGETLEEGLKRELREELGADAVIGGPFYAFTYLKDENTHSLEIIHLCQLKNPAGLRLDPEALQAYRWVDREGAMALYDSAGAEFPAIVKGFDLIRTKP